MRINEKYIVVYTSNMNDWRLIIHIQFGAILNDKVR